MTNLNMNTAKKRNLQVSDAIVDSKNDVSCVSGTYKCNGEVYAVSAKVNVPSDDPPPPQPPPEDADIESMAVEKVPQIEQERWWQTTVQVGIPFLIAGFGTIAAGAVLAWVEGWKAFESIPQLFILVPALLGLKGNLVMTLAARLSTQANLGNMSSTKEIVHMVVGNVAIVQVQATVAALLIAMFAMGFGAIAGHGFRLEHVMLVTTAAMFTATVSCFLLSLLMVAIIIVSDRYKVNPDNLATPFAASIGDIISISVLSFAVYFLYASIETKLWITYLVLAIYFAILPFWVILVLRNRYTRPVLTSGWIPVILSLLISGAGGIVLKSAVDEFNGFVVFQPIINGIGGNLVAVQASRMSTFLNQMSTPGRIPPKTRIVEWPWRALFYGTPYSKAARIMLLISIPGQVLFIFVADFFHMWASTIGAPFVFSYLTASLIQIMSLLYIAHVMVHAMWRLKVDPDTAAIPYLTALGDLLGSSMLLVAFMFLRAIGHEYDP